MNKKRGVGGVNGGRGGDQTVSGGSKHVSRRKMWACVSSNEKRRRAAREGAAFRCFCVFSLPLLGKEVGCCCCCSNDSGRVDPCGDECTGVHKGAAKPALSGGKERGSSASSASA